MKKIEDYLHLYLGCDCITTIEEMEQCQLRGYSVEPDCGNFADLKFIDKDSGDYITIPTNRIDEIKPILRPLSDMSEEEAKEMGIWHDWARKTLVAIFWTPEMVRQALSKYFDIFNLIEAGLAIDAKALINTNTN